MYGFKECSSCGALYNREHCCSKVISVDNFVRDPNSISYDETPDLSQQPPRNCSKCGGPFGGLYFQQCTCERCRRNYTDEVCALCCYEVEKSFVNDSNPNSFIDSPNIFYPPSQPQTSLLDQWHCFHCKDPLERGERCKWCSCKWCGSGLSEGFCFICALNNKNSSIGDPNPNSFNDSQNLSDYPLQPQYQTYSCELCRKNAHYGYDCPPQVPFHAFREKQHQPEDIQELLHKLLKDLQIISEELAEYINSPSWNCPAFYDDDDEYTIQYREYLENSSNAITPDLPTEEPDNSLSMGDEHLSTILETESDKLIKSSVENLVPIPSESEDFSDNESECDVPVCDDFTTFSNPLFDSDDDFSSSDDESFSDEDVPKENFKIYSNPLFDEEIISSKIDPHHFNAESDLIESLLNRDISTVSYPKIDYLLEEFSGELTHINLIPPGINEADFDPEEEIRLIEELLYDNSSPRPPEESNSEIFDATIESFSPSPIPVEDSDSLMEEIDLFLDPDDSIPPGILSDDYDSEGDILFLEELLSNDSLSLPETESFHFDHYDVPSSPRPPAKLSDDGIFFDFEADTGVLPAKVVEDISEHHVLMLKWGKITFDFSKSPMMISRGDIPFLDVLIALDFEDSRARGFVHRPLDLRSLTCLYMGIRYPRSY
ncbi:hypothetical protein Tco_0774889 [Tanacetum coccineum]|uniref:Uncharacterized protein n=1 Tax=Tanacetum coccineum TaxID=301880 RepID=A0ABQ4ZTT6_9ASTR